MWLSTKFYGEIRFQNIFSFHYPAIQNGLKIWKRKIFYYLRWNRFMNNGNILLFMKNTTSKIADAKCGYFSGGVFCTLIQPFNQYIGNCPWYEIQLISRGRIGRHISCKFHNISVECLLDQASESIMIQCQKISFSDKTTGQCFFKSDSFGYLIFHLYIIHRCFWHHFTYYAGAFTKQPDYLQYAKELAEAGKWS